MRQVLPELLDSLPHDAPAAVRSRCELRLINRLMGNHRWLCRALRTHEGRSRRVLEFGAGDGSLARRAWHEGVLPVARWTALDLAPPPPDWPRDATWCRGDLLVLPVFPEAEIGVANLFLHHLRDGQLAELGARLPAACRVFLACEPARRRAHSLQGRLLSAMLRFSPVTRHDLLISIRAGFRGDELPRALGLAGWTTAVTLTAVGAYRLVACR